MFEGAIGLDVPKLPRYGGGLDVPKLAKGVDGLCTAMRVEAIGDTLFLAFGKV